MTTDKHWWENEFISTRGGRLLLAGRGAAGIAAENGTPLFVYGGSRILANLRTLEEGFPARSRYTPEICFAMKANPHPGILRILAGRGICIDAVSPAEVRAALEAGFPAERIMYTGTSVGAADLEQAFAVDGLIVNIDAAEQVDIMAAVRRRRFRGKKIRVSVRWNPGIGGGFNAKVITSGARSTDGTPIKFGVENGRLAGVFAAARKAGFSPIGLHQHLGSGWTGRDYPKAREAVHRMVNTAIELRRKGFGLEFLDFGGGFNPRYSGAQRTFPVKKYFSEIVRSVSEAGLDIRAIAVEPGKFLIADAGVLLLGVNYVKKSCGNIFACVDGGTFTSVPRPAIYPEARHEIVNAMRVDGAPRTRITVAGNLCETGDIFAKDRPMPLPRRGDILAVLCAGAYCRSMASNFNLRDIPREIIL